MQIGLIGGIGPAATDFYYRTLIQKFASADAELDMTIVHADAPTLVKNLMSDNKDAQVEIYEGLTQRLKDAGADCVAVTSIAGHFCIENFQEKSVLPVVDMLSCVEKEVRNRGYKKIGILGTKPVMESKFYAGITSAEVILPEENLLEEVHKSYVDMATLGSANDEQRKVFELACDQFLKINKVDAVMLGGTDLALVYHASNVDFKRVDHAEIQAQKLFDFHQK
jgi:aspartate racemase